MSKKANGNLTDNNKWRAVAIFLIGLLVFIIDFIIENVLDVETGCSILIILSAVVVVVIALIEIAAKIKKRKAIAHPQDASFPK